LKGDPGFGADRIGCLFLGVFAAFLLGIILAPVVYQKPSHDAAWELYQSLDEPFATHPTIFPSPSSQKQLELAWRLYTE
jgi:hypothetical protein